MLQIVYLIIENFEIQSNMDFEIVKINNVTFDEVFNLLVYKSMRKKKF
jgi:hypothetical protein